MIFVWNGKYADPLIKVDIIKKNNVILSPLLYQKLLI